MSHLGQNRTKQSYESKTRQSLVLELRQQNSYIASAISRLTVMLARAVFSSSGDFARVWIRYERSHMSPGKDRVFHKVRWFAPSDLIEK